MIFKERIFFYIYFKIKKLILFKKNLNIVLVNLKFIVKYAKRERKKHQFK